MNVLDFLARMPPEAYAAFGKLLTALLSGDVAKAERQARVTAETIAAKLVLKKAWEAGRRTK